jgi:hypothetical protein
MTNEERAHIWVADCLALIGQKRFDHAIYEQTNLHPFARKVTRDYRRDRDGHRWWKRITG